MQHSQYPVDEPEDLSDHGVALVVVVLEVIWDFAILILFGWVCEGTVGDLMFRSLLFSFVRGRHGDLEKFLVLVAQEMRDVFIRISLEE